MKNNENSAGSALLEWNIFAFGRPFLHAKREICKSWTLLLVRLRPFERPWSVSSGQAT